MLNYLAKKGVKFELVKIAFFCIDLRTNFKSKTTFLSEKIKYLIRLLGFKNILQFWRKNKIDILCPKWAINSYKKLVRWCPFFFYISHYLATTKSQLNATTICSFSRYSIIIRISYHIIDFLTDTLNKELIIMKQNENRFLIKGPKGEGSRGKYGT